jgi:tRNA threonylcarbamoyl adenosine modification protein YeaZ
VVLCIDTATEHSGIALVGNEKKNGFLPLVRAHTSDNIIKKIDQLIKKADIRLLDLKGVFVVKGPGSFTGLRVGISVANQFAHQLEIPIIGICCDELYSYMSKEKDYFYIQSMNTDQIYMVGYGKYKRDYPREIVSISECHHELIENPGSAIFGQISEKHKIYFKDIKLILSKENLIGSWARLAQENPFIARRKYQLIEPYYAKNPTITISNKKI